MHIDPDFPPGPDPDSHPDPDASPPRGGGNGPVRFEAGPETTKPTPQRARVIHLN